jgi:hypothetical protein
MADAVTTQTQSKFPRAELAELARGNPRMVKALEALFMDVGKTLPDAIAQQVNDSNSLLGTRAFLPPPMPNLPVNDAAAAILASQIFGA